MNKVSKFKYFFATFDVLIVLFSIIESVFFYRFYNQNYFPFHTYPTIEFLILSLFIVIYFIIIFENNNLYKLNVILIKSKHLTNLIKSLSYGVIGIILFSFITKFPLINNSRLLLVSFYFISIFTFFIVRVLVLRTIYLYLKDYKLLKNNILILGSGTTAQLLAYKIRLENHYSINIIGFIDDNRLKGERVTDNLYIEGKLTDLPNLKNKKNIDEIFIALDDVDYERILDILDYCNNLGLNVKLTSELFNIVHQKMEIEVFSDLPIIELSNKLSPKINSISKKIIDIIGSFIALIIFSPIFIVTAILIKLTSPGPIFYKQKRIGINGKPFIFIKFRSMYVSNDSDIERKKKMIEFMKGNFQQNDNDTKIITCQRVTKIGNFIRRTSIDELPQLINVLKGDMSLVGPRPCLLYEFEHYHNWQKRRFSILPGCTGVWQTSGRSNVSFSDSVILDIYYVNNMSPWFDLQLIFKTIPVMLLCKGGE